MTTPPSVGASKNAIKDLVLAAHAVATKCGDGGYGPNMQRDPLMKSLHRAVGRVLGNERDTLLGPDEIQVRAWQAQLAHRGEDLVRAAVKTLATFDEMAQAWDDSMAYEKDVLQGLQKALQPLEEVNLFFDVATFKVFAAFLHHKSDTSGLPWRADSGVLEYWYNADGSQVNIVAQWDLPPEHLAASEAERKGPVVHRLYVGLKIPESAAFLRFLARLQDLRGIYVLADGNHLVEVNYKDLPDEIILA